MKLQKRLAGHVLGSSSKRVAFDDQKLDEIKEAITKRDIKNLIQRGVIIEKQPKGVSRGRSNKKKQQKIKGRKRGQGSRKGRASARGETTKQEWVNKIRLQRSFILALKKGEHVDGKIYRELYRKTKGGFFRSKRHIALYLQEKGLLKK